MPATHVWNAHMSVANILKGGGAAECFLRRGIRVLGIVGRRSCCVTASSTHL